MSTANRVLKNTLILYAKTGITMFLSLYTTRVVLRELGADSFGVFALIGGIIAMFGFLNGSMAAATQRFMSYAHGKEDDHEQQDIFSISLVLHSAVAVIAVLLLLSIGPLLFAHVLKIDAAHLETARILYNVVALSVIFPVLAVPYQAVIIARENMLMLALVGFLESLLKFGVAIYITHASGDKLLIYGILMAAIPAILLLTQGLVCHARYTECRFSLSGIRNRRLTREMLSFGGWSFLGSASSFLTHNSQGIVLNSFFGSTINAAQGISNQVSGQLSVLALSLERALSPIITKREGANQRNRMLEAVTTGSKFALLLKAIVFLPVILDMNYIFSKWLVVLPPYTVIFCRIYLARNLIETLTSQLSAGISSVGEIRTFQVVNSALTPLPILASIILFRMDFKPDALYMAFLVNAVIQYAVSIYYFQSLCGLSPFSYILDVPVRLALVFSFSLLVSLIPLCLLEPGYLRTALIFLCCCLCMAVTSFTILMNKREKLMINKFASSLIITFKGRLKAYQLQH